MTGGVCAFHAQIHVLHLHVQPVACIQHECVSCFSTPREITYACECVLHNLVQTCLPKGLEIVRGPRTLRPRPRLQMQTG